MMKSYILNVCKARLLYEDCGASQQPAHTLLSSYNLNDENLPHVRCKVAYEVWCAEEVKNDWARHLQSSWSLLPPTRRRSWSIVVCQHLAILSALLWSDDGFGTIS